jgi:hypothetical protein
MRPNAAIAALLIAFGPDIHVAKAQQGICNFYGVCNGYGSGPTVNVYPPNITIIVPSVPSPSAQTAADFTQYFLPESGSNGEEVSCLFKETVNGEAPCWTARSARKLYCSPIRGPVPPSGNGKPIRCNASASSSYLSKYPVTIFDY